MPQYSLMAKPLQPNQTRRISANADRQELGRVLNTFIYVKIFNREFQKAFVDHRYLFIYISSNRIP
jgi:hypothetical protein